MTEQEFQQAVLARFGKIDGRLDGLENGIGELAGKMAGMETRLVRQIQAAKGELLGAIIDQGNVANTRFERLEERVDRLERFLPAAE